MGEGMGDVWVGGRGMAGKSLGDVERGNERSRGSHVCRR